MIILGREIKLSWFFSAQFLHDDNLSFFTGIGRVEADVDYLLLILVRFLLFQNASVIGNMFIYWHILSLTLNNAVIR